MDDKPSPKGAWLRSDDALVAVFMTLTDLQGHSPVALAHGILNCVALSRHQLTLRRSYTTNEPLVRHRNCTLINSTTSFR